MLFPRPDAAEQCPVEFVDTANKFAVNAMPDDRKRTYGKDLLLASALVAAGLLISAVSLSEIKARNLLLAQGTQPLQSTPGAETKPQAPAEPITTGTRPSTPAPQPAHPDAEAQKAGAQPALPPAPAEKTAPPIREK
jgi:hypothetical protein